MKNKQFGTVYVVWLHTMCMGCSIFLTELYVSVSVFPLSTELRLTRNLQYDLQSDTFRNARARVELSFDAMHHARRIHFVILNTTHNVCMCYFVAYLVIFILLYCIVLFNAKMFCTNMRLNKFELINSRPSFWFVSIKFQI